VVDEARPASNPDVATAPDGKHLARVTSPA
jgi:hypothetical protein